MSSSSAAVEPAARLVLGTAALGLPYGLPPPGASAPVLMPEAEAIGLVRAALDAGVRRFDTAPAYGDAERRLGLGLGTAGEVWTKFDHRMHGGDLAAALDASIGESLIRLRRPRLEVFHWHNWSRAVGDDPAFRTAWPRLGGDPRLGVLACSTYGPEDALAAVESGWFRLVQVEANLLNRRVLRAIAAPARARGVRIAVRSVFLQGVLTPKGGDLPERLAGLRGPRAAAEALAERLGLPLHHLALRAILDDPAVDAVLIGLDGRDQLAEALAAAARPALAATTFDRFTALEPADPTLTDPRAWPR